MAKKITVKGTLLKDIRLSDASVTKSQVQAAIDEATSYADTAKTTAESAKKTAEQNTVKNTEQDKSIAAVQTKNTEQDTSIAEAKAKNEEQEKSITDLNQHINDWSKSLSSLDMTDAQSSLTQLKEIIGQIIKTFGGTVRKTTMVSFDVTQDDIDSGNNEVSIEVPIKMYPNKDVNIQWE